MDFTATALSLDFSSRVSGAGGGVNRRDGSGSRWSFESLTAERGYKGRRVGRGRRLRPARAAKVSEGTGEKPGDDRASCHRPANERPTTGFVTIYARVEGELYGSGCDSAATSEIGQT